MLHDGLPVGRSGKVAAKQPEQYGRTAAKANCPWHLRAGNRANQEHPACARLVPGLRPTCADLRGTCFIGGDTGAIYPPASAPAGTADAVTNSLAAGGHTRVECWVEDCVAGPGCRGKTMEIPLADYLAASTPRRRKTHNGAHRLRRSVQRRHDRERADPDLHRAGARGAIRLRPPARHALYDPAKPG